MDGAPAMPAEQVEAILHERLVRHVSCLDLTETVGHFELVPLTLRRWTALRIMESPYLMPFRSPVEAETIQFLWIVSPDYIAGNGKEAMRRRKILERSCWPFVPRFEPLIKTRLSLARYALHRERCVREHAKVAIACRDYMEETMQDAPLPSHGELMPRQEYYCDAVAMCCACARAFGGGPAIYMDMPMKFLFQALKENTAAEYAAAGKPALLHNPSDRFLQQELEELNAKLKANRKN